MDSKNPFVLILSGQPLIRNKLTLNVNNPLRQRLTVHYFLHGLKEEELPFYCQSRFKLAGLSEEIITPAAYGAIHSITNGLPRLVNNLITACLLCACAKRQKHEEVVYQAQQELNF